MSCAVITGTSRGIGRATALEFAARGVPLALLGRHSPAQESCLNACRERCREWGVEARHYVCDVADPTAIDAAAEALLADFGPPTTLIHNAGILIRGPKLHQLALDDWNQLMAVNLRAPFLLSRALLPAMLKQGSGRILHLVSVSGTLACPEASAYGASKWALIGLSKSLAAELEGTGLQSIALLPGAVDTDMLKQTPFKPAITAEDVARLIAYYALEAPAGVNGAAVEMFG